MTYDRPSWFAGETKAAGSTRVHTFSLMGLSRPAAFYLAAGWRRGKGSEAGPIPSARSCSQRSRKRVSDLCLSVYS